ncbi:signal peptidase II [Keratinibaculum paraultunense]|uniref:Lipoprotein signal peptidase n=1 Tax=Keratinibaculum paraultunense TaxID=1278232 RepID=A0A4R3KVE7_9FIRM|nr:signal peptidase II [Keratinibaculum paraultunense]QQY78733.1 signal peptidase II [Keratinibaculum paraultunense]TCS89589.1 signal peptidase II [Keratinibaculum paraultunense]
MWYLITILVIVLDQITKYLAVKYLKGKSSFVIIEDFLQLYYVENYGAAFGILQNRKIFFIIVTSIVIISIVFFLCKNPYNLSKIMQIALSMLLGGSIGNLIDRIRLGYVVDFISIRIGKGYDFPVFNIADTFIVIGTFLIVIMVLLDRYEA